LKIPALNAAQIKFLAARMREKMARAPKPTLPSPQPDSPPSTSSPSPNLTILGPKQVRYLVAIAKLKAVGATPEQIEHFGNLVRSRAPTAKPLESPRQTVPGQTPAEVAKNLAPFPPDDSLKIN
jgi:hypothetical protein